MIEAEEQFKKIGKYEYRIVSNGVDFQLQRRKKTIFGTFKIQATIANKNGLFWLNCKDMISFSEYELKETVISRLKMIMNAGGE